MTRARHPGKSVCCSIGSTVNGEAKTSGIRFDSYSNRRSGRRRWRWCRRSCWGWGRRRSWHCSAVQFRTHKVAAVVITPFSPDSENLAIGQQGCSVMSASDVQGGRMRPSSARWVVQFGRDGRIITIRFSPDNKDGTVGQQARRAIPAPDIEAPCICPSAA